MKKDIIYNRIEYNIGCDVIYLWVVEGDGEKLGRRKEGEERKEKQSVASLIEY